MQSAGAPPAGDESPAAAAGGAAGRSAGQERCRDSGLQRERSHAQQRYTDSQHGGTSQQQPDHTSVNDAVTV